jgi:septation ring formation regulator EzrA
MKDIEIKKIFDDLECEIKNTPKEILLKEIEEIEKEAQSLPENQYDEFFNYLEQEYNEEYQAKTARYIFY